MSTLGALDEFDLDKEASNVDPTTMFELKVKVGEGCAPHPPLALRHAIITWRSFF